MQNQISGIFNLHKSYFTVHLMKYVGNLRICILVHLNVVISSVYRYFHETGLILISKSNVKISASKQEKICVEFLNKTCLLHCRVCADTWHLNVWPNYFISPKSIPKMRHFTRNSRIHLVGNLHQLRWYFYIFWYKSKRNISNSVESLWPQTKKSCTYTPVFVWGPQAATSNICRVCAS